MRAYAAMPRKADDLDVAKDKRLNRITPRTSPGQEGRMNAKMQQREVR
jgi:hypothetical protein